MNALKGIILFLILLLGLQLPDFNLISSENEVQLRRFGKILFTTDTYFGEQQSQSKTAYDLFSIPGIKPSLAPSEYSQHVIYATPALIHSYSRTHGIHARAPPVI